jgi:hypothetical protein
MVIDYRMGETLRLRKKHPCGGFDWEVVRLGADIGIVCTTCSRKVLMPRSTLEKRMKTRLTGEAST